MPFLQDGLLTANTHRQTHRHTETHRHTHTDTHRHTQTHTQTRTDTRTHRHTRPCGTQKTGGRCRIAQGLARGPRRPPGAGSEGGSEGAGVCPSRADPLCCTAETNTTLQSNYTIINETQISKKKINWYILVSILNAFCVLLYVT